MSFQKIMIVTFVLFSCGFQNACEVSSRTKKRLPLPVMGGHSLASQNDLLTEQIQELEEENSRLRKGLQGAHVIIVRLNDQLGTQAEYRKALTKTISDIVLSNNELRLKLRETSDRNECLTAISSFVAALSVTLFCLTPSCNKNV
ncbi:MAG: hypothetical protein WCJ33_10270 [Pseudomonadota bacterium]